MSWEALAALIAATLAAGTPLLLAATGLLINERAGVLNLGAEGMMLIAAVAGFAAGVETGSVAVGFVAGLFAGMAFAGIFAVLAVGLATNQYATGLALTLFGTGLSAFIGLPYVGRASDFAAPLKLPLLVDIPWLGAALFSQHPMVYLAWALVAFVAWVLLKTKVGLVIRAVGESPESAHALGYPVRSIRIAAVLFGGACCGLAVAFL